jgi:hypothetical protein
VLEVSRRSANEYAVFDGQHRLVVLRERGARWSAASSTAASPRAGGGPVPQAPGQPAPLTPLDKYKSRLFAGEPIAKGIQVITDELGWKIGTGPGRLQSIVVAERVYRRGNLYNTLDIMGIWAGDAKVVEGSLIDGVSRFLDLFPEADMSRVRNQWMAVSPTVIIRRSAEFMASAHSSKAYGVLEVLRDLYTSRQFRLPTVAQAQEERARTRSGGVARYRRVTGVEVRDAILELDKKKRDAGEDPPMWTIDELREELGGISREALTRRGAHISQFIERGMIERKRDGSYGSYRYRYIPVEQQKPSTSRRKSGGKNGKRSEDQRLAGRALHRQAEQRTGGQNKRSAMQRRGTEDRPEVTVFGAGVVAARAILHRETRVRVPGPDCPCSSADRATGLCCG